MLFYMFDGLNGDYYFIQADLIEVEQILKDIIFILFFSCIKLRDYLFIIMNY